MRRVILESPYAADEDKIEKLLRDRGVRPLEDCWFPMAVVARRNLIEENVAYARAAVRHSLMLGEAPIASHLLYTQPGILNDDVSSERKWGIDAGLEWRKVAQASVVYVDRGVTKGMKLGIMAALEVNIPVEFRSIEGDAALEKRVTKELTPAGLSAYKESVPGTGPVETQRKGLASETHRTGVSGPEQPD